MQKVIVIEICERSLVSAAACNDVPSALRKANFLLKNHVNDIDYADEFKSREDEHEEWELATEDSMNAWCNWRGYRWDAYVIEPQVIMGVSSKKTYETIEDVLVEKIQNDSVLDIEEFLGYPISADVLEGLDERIREVLDQMPEEELLRFKRKYNLFSESSTEKQESGQPVEQAAPQHERRGTDVPKDVSLRVDLLVTMGCRAGSMESAGYISLPSGVEGEAELAEFVADTVDKYIEGCDESFDLYIEAALEEKYGKPRL